MTPSPTDLWFLPLGGCGEIGMNMNLYGHDGQWLMVDCGVTFRDPDGGNSSGHDIQMADPEFAVERRDALQGLLLTHGHEDHIGAVARLWPRLRCPVYANEFTAEMLRRKLGEFGLETRLPLHVIRAGDTTVHGAFEVEWVRNTHSIPDPCALAIRTPAGTVFHTGDWKLDPEPVVGHDYDRAAYERIGRDGVDAMVCDSTSADREGHSLSEAELLPGLRHHVETAPGRVIVACFGSNIARLQTLATVAHETRRHIGLLGRSLITTANAARAVGLWTERETLVESEHLGYLPRETLLLVATGSQGEPRAALSRLSRGAFRSLSLDPGDRVVFSARAIPGNEPEIDRMVDRLAGLGVDVVRSETSELPIHASGHPRADELRALYGWVRPKALVPVHGEPMHMDAQCAIAREAGVPEQLTGLNGDLFTIAPTLGVRRGAVRAGRLGSGARNLEKMADKHVVRHGSPAAPPPAASATPASS